MAPRRQPRFDDRNANGVFDGTDSFLDANGNGRFDGGDRWVDLNHNGVFDINSDVFFEFDAAPGGWATYGSTATAMECPARSCS